MTNTIINKHNENKNTAGNITKRRRHPVYTIIALTALLIISAFLSIMLGSVQLKPADIMRCLTGSDKSSVTYVLIMNIRLPRMISAIVAGIQDYNNAIPQRLLVKVCGRCYTSERYE